jgi:hypothetical protein
MGVGLQEHLDIIEETFSIFGVKNISIRELGQVRKKDLKGSHHIWRA